MRKKNGYLSLSLVIALCMLMVIIPFLNSLAKQTEKLDESKYFYPKTYSIPDSLPYFYVQIGNFVHVRYVETGQIVNAIELRENEEAIRFDEDSMLTFQINDLSDTIAKYRRFDIDGTIEEFILDWEDISNSGNHMHNSRIVFLDNQPIEICVDSKVTEISETGEKVETRLYARNKDGVLWEKTGRDGVSYHLPRTWLPNKEYTNIKRVSKKTNNSEYVETNQITNILTGEVIYSVDGFYYMWRGNSRWDNDFVFLFPYSKDGEKIIILDTKTGNIVCEPTKDYNVFFFEDHFWLTSKAGMSVYRYGQTDGFKVKRFERDGTLTEEFELSPEIPSLAFDYCKVISNNIAVIGDRIHHRLFNFRTGRQLRVNPGRLQHIYQTEDVIIIQDEYRIYGLNNTTFEIIWELESIKTERIERIETDNQIFLGYRYASTDDECTDRITEYDCGILRIKVVNKADMSLEPYEYTIQPFCGDIERIHPSSYGLVAFGSGFISLHAPGNITKYKVSFPSRVTQFSEMENPRYLKITLDYLDDTEKIMIFDIETGLYKKTIEQ